MALSSEAQSQTGDQHQTRNQEPSAVERARALTQLPAVAVKQTALDEGTLVLDCGQVGAMAEPALEATLSLPDGGTISIMLRGKDDRLIIGRDPEQSHITISDPRVSRQHLAIGVDETAAYMQDLGSANGTFLNGLRVRQREALYDGDAVRLGQVEITFQSR